MSRFTPHLPALALGLLAVIVLSALFVLRGSWDRVWGDESTFLSMSESLVEDGDLLSDDATAAGTLSSLYVTAVAVAEGGARPMGLTGHYDRDMDHIRAYAEAAKTPAGFQDYLEREVLAGGEA